MSLYSSVSYCPKAEREMPVCSASFQGSPHGLSACPLVSPVWLKSHSFPPSLSKKVLFISISHFLKRGNSLFYRPISNLMDIWDGRLKKYTAPRSNRAKYCESCARKVHRRQSPIEQAGCPTRKDSTQFVGTLITAQGGFANYSLLRRTSFKC